MWSYILFAQLLPPLLCGLAEVVEATGIYLEALLAWSACGGGDSK